MDKKEETKKKEKKVKEPKVSKELVAALETIKEKDDKILRLTAEMQNIIRRNDEERSKFLKYDGEHLIVQLLPVLDNFEHAVLMDDANLSDELSKFLSGFKMIYGNLVELLKKEEVKEIECLHKPFDDNMMHAVLTDNVKEYEDNIVIDVMQKGYMYKDKVIRPAMVKVNKR